MGNYFAKAVAVSEETIKVIGEILIQVLNLIFTFKSKKAEKKSNNYHIEEKDEYDDE